MRISATIIFLIVFTAAGVFAQQWKQTRGPQAGYFSAVCGQGTDLFAVTTRGNIFKFDGTAWYFASNAGTSVI